MYPFKANLAQSNDTGFIISHALQAEAVRELARVRASRSLFARLGESLRRATFPRNLMPRYASRASYYKHCKAALTHALVPYWEGSRSDLKARVREILHPRRRDVSLLGGLLRATVAPAALAIFMLAATAESAHADSFCTVSFNEQFGVPNPFEGVDVGVFAKPAFADLDGDGDLDALVGEILGSLKYFLNTGTALAPVFVEQMGSANPFDGVDVEYFSAPAFADLDGDGDQDALVGDDYGTLRYFQNTGTALAPVFSEQTGAANPFNLVDVGRRGTPAFADLDGDGDLDALVGESYGSLEYFLNTGTAVAPVFVKQTGADNPFNGVDVVNESAPAFADLDGDGDLDAIVGDSYGTLRYFQNTSTALAPAFVEQTGGDNPFGGVDVGDFSTPALADLDGDGDLDTLVGEYSGTLKYFQGDMLQDSVPPVITLTGDAVVTVECGGEYSELGATADDDCAGAFAATVGGETVDTATPGDYTITYNATDGLNPANEVTRSVTVQDTTPPDITLEGDAAVTVECGGSYTVQGATANDDCEGTVSVTVGGDTVDTATPGDYTITYNATDGTNPATEVTRTVTVQDTIAPTIELNGDAAVTVECGGTYDELGATASDACEGTVSVTVGGDTVDTTTPGEYTVTYNATDGTNASTEVIRTVTVQDSIAPTIELNGDAAVTVECGGTYDELGATASDTCVGSFAATVGGDTVDTGTPGEYTVTYNATDGSNAAIEVTRTVIVQDTTGPVITDRDGPVIVYSCGSTYSDEGVAASDACEGIVSVTVGGDTVDTDTPDQYFITYNATDGTNLATQVTRIVIVQGNCHPEGEGTAEGEGVTEGATDGEGSLDGEGEGTVDGDVDGEGEPLGIYAQALLAFGSADANHDSVLTLAEIQALLPAFTQSDLLAADANGNGNLSVAELLQVNGGGILVSADTSGDSIVQLTELLRLIQLYNAGLYACAENAGATEDGYSLSATLNEPACVLHSIDQNGDKVITLSELLRGIQLYNLGGYTWCPGGGTEDGFCG